MVTQQSLAGAYKGSVKAVGCIYEVFDSTLERSEKVFVQRS